MRKKALALVVATTLTVVAVTLVSCGKANPYEGTKWYTAYLSGDANNKSGEIRVIDFGESDFVVNISDSVAEWNSRDQWHAALNSLIVFDNRPYNYHKDTNRAEFGTGNCEITTKDGRQLLNYNDASHSRTYYPILDEAVDALYSEEGVEETLTLENSTRGQ